MNTTQTIITTWLKKNPLVFRTRWDADKLTLIENTTGKEIILDTAHIVNHRVHQNPQSGGAYLNLVYDDGREIILCHAGIAFAPNFAATGPLPDAPPVACLMDYTTLLQTLLAMQNDDTRRGEAILLFQILISILDGAKVVGFDVGVEEELLDKYLAEFENQIPPSPPY